MSATATVTATNGKPARKQLGHQLDRLDSIIDLLADRLPEAVADATREGARQAVKDVIVELLSNPELRAMIAGLAPAAPPVPVPEPTPTIEPTPAPAQPTFWDRVKENCKAAKDGAVRRCGDAATAVGSAYRALSAVMPLKKMLVVGAGVGLAVGVTSFVCPHGVSAVVGGVGAACTAVGVQVGNWFRRSAKFLGLSRES